MIVPSQCWVRERRNTVITSGHPLGFDRLELEFPVKHMQVTLCWNDEHMVGLED